MENEKAKEIFISLISTISNKELYLIICKWPEAKAIAYLIINDTIEGV